MIGSVVIFISSVSCVLNFEGSLTVVMEVAMYTGAFTY